MSIFSRLIDKQINGYQRELIETHYAEVDNMYGLFDNAIEANRSF